MEPEPTPGRYEWRFPIDHDIDLILRGPEGFPSEEGSHTLAVAAEVLSGALATIWHKDKHYRGAWREQGWMGNLARILSKSARLRSMLWKEDVLLPTTQDQETVQDTLQDMINLCVFMMLNRQGGNKWGRRA